MLRKHTRLAAAGVVLAGLAAGGLGAALPSAHATSVVGTYRFGGVNRYDTARLIGTYTPQGGSAPLFTPVIQGVLASGDNFPDALSSNFLAGSLGSPIFLTAAGSLSPEALAGIKALDIHTIAIIGGPAAVSPSVETDLNNAGILTTRVSGPNRDATAAAVAQQPGTSVGSYNGLGATALLAADDAAHYVDALAGGPLSFAGHFPILLTPGSSLAPEASAALTALKIKHVIILGGTAAILPAVQTQVESLGITVERLSGAVRQQTAIAIAGAEQAHLGFGTNAYVLARGDNFPDALAGGPLGGKDSAPILLTVDPNTLGTDTQTFLTTNNAHVNELFVLGGTAAISDAVVSAASGAATCSSGTPGTTSTTAGSSASTTLPSTTLPTTSTTAATTTTVSLPACTGATTTTSSSSTSSSTTTTTGP